MKALLFIALLIIVFGDCGGGSDTYSVTSESNGCFNLTGME